MLPVVPAWYCTFLHGIARFAIPYRTSTGTHPDQVWTCRGKLELELERVKYCNQQ